MEFDFYAYGDFISIVNSFKMVAGIFSSNTFKSWITVVMLFSIVSFAFHMNMERIFGAKLNDTVWIKRMFWGLALYTIFMVPTVTMHIYDPVKNRYEAVGGVPLGAGMIASVTSSASRELSELIETAGGPIMSMNDIGFGEGFELLAASSSLGQIGNMQDHFLAKSVYDYIDKCFYQAYANGDITDNDIWTSHNLLESFRLDYRVFSSVVYDSANPGGVLMECADAYTNISARLLNPTFTENVLYSFCSKAGYQVGNAMEYQACKDKFSGLVSAFATESGFTYTLTNYVASAFVARQYLLGGVNAGVQNAIAIAKSMATAANTVAGGVADEYIPKLQGMIITILISTFIIVALFVYMAPVDAFKWYIGMWIWVILWFVVDAIININVQVHAYEVFRDIRSSGVGLNTMFYTGHDTLKVLAMYSNARWMSMTLASVISFGIIKMGGSAAFASMTASLGQQYRSSAGAVGSQLGTPGGQAGFQSNLYDQAADLPSMTGMKTPTNLSVSQYNKSLQVGQTLESTSLMMEKYSDASAAVKAMGTGDHVRNMENIGHGAGAVRAEAETGVSIEDGASVQTMKQHSENAGIKDVVDSGKVGSDTFRDTAAYNALDAKGRMLAAEGMSRDLGLDYDKISQNLNTKSGMESYAKYQNIKDFADRNGMSMKDVFDKSSRSASLSLSDAEAQKMGLAEGGIYSMSWDESGNMTYTDMKSGSQIWRGDRDTTEDMLIVSEGKHLWSGIKSVREDTSKSVRDHLDTDVSGSRRIAEDTDKTVADRGIDYNEDSTYNGTYRMAATERGADQLATAVWNNAKLRSRRDGIEFEDALRYELSAQTEDWTGTVNKFFKKDGKIEGQYIHSENASAELSLKIFGVGFGVSALQQMNTKNSENEATNLLTAGATQNYENVIKEAKTEDGYSKEGFVNAYSNSMYQNTNTVQQYLEKDQGDFGKDSVVPSLSVSAKYEDNSQNPLLADKIKDFEREN
jgi:conjugal transfer mating pair stabilization protein TraG